MCKLFNAKLFFIFRVKVVSQNPQFPKSHIYRDSAPKTKIANNLKPGVRYRFSIYTVRDGMLSRPLIKDVNTGMKSTPRGVLVFRYNYSFIIHNHLLCFLDNS